MMDKEMDGMMGRCMIGCMNKWTETHQVRFLTDIDNERI